MLPSSANVLRFTDANRAPRSWLLEYRKAAVRVRWNHKLAAGRADVAVERMAIALSPHAWGATAYTSAWNGEAAGMRRGSRACVEDPSSKSQEVATAVDHDAG